MRLQRPGLGHSHFFSDAFGGGKLIQARGCPSRQGSPGNIVRVIALVKVLSYFGLGQGDDPGTGHCLLGDFQHLPARISVRNTLL